MGVYDNVFPLGLGTARFPVQPDNPEPGIEESVNIVLRALDMGVNYIDTAPIYSSGFAPEVLRRALQKTDKPYRITTKISSKLKTAEAVRKTVMQHLELMGLERATDIMLWTVLSYAEFEEIMKPGGVYEGALQLKEEGIVDHITFSAHAPTGDLIKILETGKVEGMMVSMSILNFTNLKPAIDRAHELGVDVAVMNPLGGGIIPRGKDRFSFVCNEEESSVVQSALRFVKAHPAVKIVLAGPASVGELEEDVRAFRDANPEPDEQRIERVIRNLSDIGEFCTGCKYCVPCPKGVPIPCLMQSRNALIFEPPHAYRRTDRDTLVNIQVFKRLSHEWGFLPETDENPCIQCGLCESKCTQRLHIIDGVADMYERMKKTGHSEKARKDRLDKLLNGKGYKKVAVWPAGASYATTVVKSYERFFGKAEFEFVYFNTSKELQGRIVDDRRIFGPDEFDEVNPDCVLVVSYTYAEEIAKNLAKYRERGIDIVKLHEENDVPWVY